MSKSSFASADLLPADIDYGALARVKELMRRAEPGFVGVLRPDGQYQITVLPPRIEREEEPAAAGMR